ncbi:nitroreductase [Azorhizobium oxalatiphilum]|uniref:Putative NAD(P)H nitroreductase n=1 Tax=Azorhizobium oxalatiphilum TaxID=980631 RepID=A0A917CED1_9HYPH|nr:nitroreductase [Azorhizobium oxalatiphilum]GGF85195.1 nitroreductase [Azorhizobium oxalatiphilum]
MPDALDLLQTRRSSRVVDLVLPGPSPEQLDIMLTIASRVPDHGKLAPWRFIVFEGEGRVRAGMALADVYAELNPDASEKRLNEERGRFARVPLVVAVVSSAAPHVKIPEWEQLLSSAAAAENLLLAAMALGYGATWITEWPTYEPKARAALGLAEHERITGFLYIGTATQALEDRPRPALADIVTRF